MKVEDDRDVHSSSSSETHIQDLEKGEARPDKEDEEAVDDMVCCFAVIDMHIGARPP